MLRSVYGKVRGATGGEVRGRRRASRAAKIAGLIVAGLLAVAAADRLLPPPLELAFRTSPVALDRNGAWLHGFVTGEGRWRFAVDLDAVDPVFVDRVIAVEDKRFRAHWGVDPLAVLRAAAASARAGRIVSGASTITMQTARLIEPRPRTLRSKMIEMIRAVQIERRLTKDEILSLYLTLAPYGGNIEGVRAASLLYFGKEPARLTDAEQALLIALPQAPEARRPDRRPAAAKAARAEVLGKLRRAGAISAQRAAEADAARLAQRRRALPRLAYHAAHRLAAEGGTTPTTLDRGLQARAEAILRAHVERHNREAADDATAALVIVETATRAVRAYIGSSGVDARGGWIDLAGAARSPGSTLKPFIYALALEDGIAGPATVIDDMPRAFGDYAPENFDRVFRGEVRLSEALQHSLNVPAVRALDRVGAPRFAALLQSAGIGLKTPARADDAPGLALALGGAGVSARDLAMLYAALGDDGRVRPLVWRPTDESPVGYRLMSARTAARISDILKGGPALAGRAPAHLSQGAPAVAFKTGTSYGYRDAWAAGHGGGYAVVAWVGRADGAARPGWTGRKAAAPLLYDIFDMLDREGALAGGARGGMAPVETTGPQAMARLGASPADAAPEIVFPRDGVSVFLSPRGLALSARGGARNYRWYVDGNPLDTEETGARAIWRPEHAGFYDVTVVDGEGRAARAKVRVHAG